MDNLARKLEIDEAVQQVGTVVRAEGRHLTVRTRGGDYRAQRATSCLIEPQAGDLVLVAALGSGACYVLSVLERDQGAPATLTHDGDLSIRLPSGRFEVAAQDGMNLVSGKDVTVTSGSVDVKAVDGSVFLERLTFLGTYVQAEIEKVKVLAGTLDSTLDRIYQRVKRSYRVVEELEQLRARQIDYAAQKTVRVHGENTIMTAEELVKLDGEQIHVG